MARIWEKYGIHASHSTKAWRTLHNFGQGV